MPFFPRRQLTPEQRAAIRYKNGPWLPLSRFVHVLDLWGFQADIWRFVNGKKYQLALVRVTKKGDA